MNATQAMPERPIRRGNLVGPTILIGLGVVFLLNNLGWLGWEVWGPLLRLWPVLLIAAGLDLLIGRRSVLGSALIVVVLLGIMGTAIWWSGAWWPGGVPVAGETITQSLDGATRADITIGMGSAHFAYMNWTIGRPSPRRDHAWAARPADAQFLGERQYGLLHATEPQSIGFVHTLWEQAIDQNVWDVRLNQDVPTKLKVDTGVGVATLDLVRLQITDLNINIGVGKTTVIMPAHGRTQAQINGGIGETIITIPAGVAVRIAAEPGLGQVRVQGDYPRQDKLYLSPNYETSANRVDLQVSGGIGSISITQEHGR